jgi:hypothetical protein
MRQSSWNQVPNCCALVIVSAQYPWPPTGPPLACCHVRDARRLESLRVAAVGVVDDRQRIIEERERREHLVAVENAEVPEEVVVRAKFQ